MRGRSAPQRVSSIAGPTILGTPRGPVGSIRNGAKPMTPAAWSNRDGPDDSLVCCRAAGRNFTWRESVLASARLSHPLGRNIMQTRPLGRTGLSVSVLGFGCGAVGGLMVRGAAADQARAVARAMEAGITYFDTAPSYGDGASERNLGRVLAELKPDVRLGTKVRLDDADKASIATALAASLDASLRRLGLDHVDLLQLHNAITEADAPGAITAQA